MVFGSDSCIWQIDLFFHRVKISREGVLSVRCGRTGRARSVEKTLKETTPCRQLRRLEPVQVIVDLGHSIGKSGAQSLQLGQSRPNRAIFSECELRNKLLIILNDRPKDRVG